MKIFIPTAVITDPHSAHNGQTASIFIENGIIAAIGTSMDGAADEVIDIPGLHVSPGFTDVFAHFNDPGHEYKETIATGTAAAKAGGYTRVMIVPNTSPALHSKAQVEYAVKQSNRVLPIGAISKNCEGKDLAEMFDMRQSGAVAFSDGLNPIQNPQVMLKALQYVKAFNGVVIQVPDEQSLSKNGLMNEGITSTRQGLPGKPAIAEHLLIARDIELLRYTNSRLHITGISTATSLQLIRRAKADGLQISCSVTPYHLHFTEEDLYNYDTNLKLNPPLRTREDVEAVKAAVLDGTVDCIASHHQPHEYDSKICEFEYAKYGMAGLESCFGAVGKALPEADPQRLVELFSTNATRIFNLAPQSIAPGEKAMLTLFVPGENWLFEKAQVRSKSSNNAFIGQTLNGRPVGSVVGNELHLIA